MTKKPTKEELRKQAEAAINEENGTTVPVDEEFAVEESPATGREAMLVRVRERYPDRDFADDDDASLYNNLDDYARERDDEIAGYRENEKKFSDMMTRDPRSANLLLALRDGKSLAVELIRLFGPELKDSLDNPELLDQLAASEKEYVERVQKSEELESEYKTNLAESLKLIDDWQNELNLSDEEVADVTGILQELTNNVILGKFSRDMLMMAYKALHHDDDVKEAESIGEVRGKNSKIDTERVRRSKGDGVPYLGGSSSRSSLTNQHRNPLFVLAESAK